MSALEDHFKSLGEWLESRGLRDWEDVRFVEDLTVSPFAKQVVEESRLHDLAGFGPRFDALLEEGHNWLNLAALGLLGGVLIVALEKPKANAGSPTTSVNRSGPPDCVRDEGNQLDKFVEIVK